MDVQVRYVQRVRRRQSGSKDCKRNAPHTRRSRHNFGRKVFSDIGGIEESDKHQHKLTSMQDVDAANKEAMASAIDTLDSMATNMAGNVNMATVKPEAASGSKDVGKVAVEGNAANATTVVAEHNNKKTFDALLDDVENETRKVLRNVAEAIATLKIMFEHPKAEKYTVELHADISKLIPSKDHG